MKFIGTDLHKKTISLCVVVVVDGQRNVISRKRLECRDIAPIREFFEQIEAFQLVVEATANYEWFLSLVKDLSDRCLQGHPKRLWVIARTEKMSGTKFVPRQRFALKGRNTVERTHQKKFHPSRATVMNLSPIFAPLRDSHWMPQATKYLAKAQRKVCRKRTSRLRFLLFNPVLPSHHILYFLLPPLDNHRERFVP